MLWLVGWAGWAGWAGWCNRHWSPHLQFVPWKELGLSLYIAGPLCSLGGTISLSIMEDCIGFWNAICV